MKKIIVGIRYPNGREEQFTATSVHYMPIPEGISIPNEYSYTLTIDVIESDDYVQRLEQENKILCHRLQHLLRSDYIRSFDEKDPRSQQYKRDIKEADARNTFSDGIERAISGMRTLAEIAKTFAESFEKETRK